VLNKPAKPIMTFMQVDTFIGWFQHGHLWHEFKTPEVSKNEDVRTKNVNY
jgi:hypothetical protein